MSTATKLTAEQIENLAKEIREFLLEHGAVPERIAANITSTERSTRVTIRRTENIITTTGSI